MIKEKYENKVGETSLSISESRIDSLRIKEIAHTGLRVYDRGLIGISGAIGSYDENDLFKKAKANLDIGIDYAFKISKNNKNTVDLRKPIIKSEEFIEEIEEFLDKLTKDQPNFIFSNRVSMMEISAGISNSEGLNLQYLDNIFLLSLAFKEKASASIMDGGIGYLGRKYNRELTLNIFNDILNAHVNKLEMPKEKKIPIIFSDSSGLAFKKILAELNGMRFGSGGSLFCGKLGEKLFSDSFTLMQCTDPEEGFTTFFDAEGVVNDGYSYTLIDKGVIKAPYTDKRTAHKYSLAHTGSAVAAFDTVPSLGPVGYRIAESGKTLKELLSGQPGIFISLASGGDYTPDGKFSTPVQCAYLHDGEKFIGRLPEFNISSDIYKMYGDDFVGISSDYLSPLSKERALVINMLIN